MTKKGQRTIYEIWHPTSKMTDKLKKDKKGKATNDKTHTKVWVKKL